MSDSVDRVFVHALQTVRRLPRTGSSRPPASSRLRLYGLYKQSMEGDVTNILPRPTVPPNSPDPSSSNVHRYASKDLRTREAQAETEKWDAWHECAGMTRTEAKRRYITTLIDTMKTYASGTQESRELVNELEFVWNQIRSQSGSSEEGGENGEGTDGESPTRRLQRAGLHPTESYTSIPPGRSNTGDGGGGRRSSQLSRDNSGLRVLSPVSRGGSGDIVEGEDADTPEAELEEDEDANSEEEFRDAPDGSEVAPPRTPQPHTPSHRPPPAQSPQNDARWRRRIESSLTRMTAEIAALREQLSESRAFTTAASRRRSGMLAWMRWLVWAAIRQAIVNMGLVALLLLWGRWRGDRRVEQWLKRRLKSLSGMLGGAG